MKRFFGTRDNGSRQGDQDPDLSRLGTMLSSLVDHETRHIHSEILTQKIVRAVHHSKSASRRLEDVFTNALMTWFRPVAVVGTLLILLLASYNAGRAHDSTYDLSATERVFAIHPVTLAAAYDLDLAPRSE